MAAVITDRTLMDHVLRLGEQHPPIRLESADRTIHDPAAVRERFAGVIDYLARVELEVDRNVLELLTILPNVREVDRIFYQDIWYGQEMAHGYLLDQLQGDLGMEPAEPFMTVPIRMKLLGAMAHLEPVQEISRMLYYLTGASTERQAVLAYSSLTKELNRMGERAIAETIIHPIKQQEPGHFAFYQMSATRMVQQQVLSPWQVFVAQQLRSRTFTLVGVDYVKKYQRDMGGVLVGLGMDQELEVYAREIGRLEARLLWANRNGMQFPPYFLKALRESVEMYQGQGNFDRPG
ncbi:GTP-binding protein LepA [Aestuariimicrobium ganziense]|uniref:GTP-binding protein LepA n=1 Tax=Aestuariimicrobium ganziense TaxID=2773677 RepID=UPI00194072A0|nr:GTP-binding protein LepA [Aestuariimicrobium ganziense]